MAKGYIGANTYKGYLGNIKMKSGYIGSTRVYSTGEIVTYVIDTGNTKQEEVDDGVSVLSPKTFTPTKSGWTFVGWREDKTANSSVLTNKVMGDNPITLYAVFKQTITLTIVNSGTTKQNKDRIYNNGNVSNPAFTVANPSKQDATFNGWSTSSGSSTITYSSISNLALSVSLTVYSVFKYSDLENINYTEIIGNALNISDSRRYLIFGFVPKWSPGNGASVVYADMTDAKGAYSSNGSGSTGIDIFQGGYAIDFSKYSAIEVGCKCKIVTNFKNSAGYLQVTCGGTTKKVVETTPYDTGSGYVGEFEGTIHVDFTQTSGSGGFCYYCVATKNTGTTIECEFFMVKDKTQQNTYSTKLIGRTIVG